MPLTGCIIDEEKKEQFWGMLPFNSIMSANPEIMQADDDADVFLFEAEAKYLLEFPSTLPQSNGYLINHKQTRSDCTSHGASGAMRSTI